VLAREATLYLWEPRGLLDSPEPAHMSLEVHRTREATSTTNIGDARCSRCLVRRVAHGTTRAKVNCHPAFVREVVVRSRHIILLGWRSDLARSKCSGI